VSAVAGAVVAAAETTGMGAPPDQADRMSSAVAPVTAARAAEDRWIRAVGTPSVDDVESRSSLTERDFSQGFASRSSKRGALVTLGHVLAVISYPPIPIWDVGPFQFSLHGVFAAIGFMAGAYLATKEMRRRGFDTVKYQSALTWGLIGALLGARYLTAPAAIINGTSILEALNPISGNFSIMGGFVGGVLAGAYRMRKVGLSVWPTLDMSAFGLALGTVVGRIGDLAIVEHLGRATDVVWGYGVKPGFDLAPQHDALECGPSAALVDGFCPVPGSPTDPGIYHHVAMYDMIGAGVLLGVLYLLSRRFPRLHYGQLFSVWVVWYGLQRFLLDSLRFGMGDAALGTFTWNQVSGLAGALGGIVLFLWLGRSQPVVSDEADRERGALLATV
jgi:phosphatidylglycerol:prolipoprotein diacylglycerol transferase